jgi:ribosomal protein L11 methyltransferase
VAIDTDPLAVEATRANAERNGLAERVDVSTGSLAPAGERFGLVLANLVAAVLVALAEPLADHLAAAGTLLVGGIIEPRAAEVRTALESAGLRVAERRDDGEWVSLRLAPRA